MMTIHLSLQRIREWRAGETGGGAEPGEAMVEVTGGET